MTEYNKSFRTKIRKHNGSLEATIPLTAVEKYGLDAGQKIKINLHGLERTVTTRRIREGSETLVITIPKDTFKQAVSKGDVVDFLFKEVEEK